ncbi:MAG: hypothetical protein MR420_05155 [Spirochaetia bacterium]|nr:hypothetical protein [Spirochaetia bacterium]
MRDSKPRNNALHAFCGIETIKLPLRSSHKKSVFEPRPRSFAPTLRKSIYNAFALLTIVNQLEKSIIDYSL